MSVSRAFALFTHALHVVVVTCRWRREQVGVGGVVLDGNGNVLMIQEKTGISVGHWKFPGGLTNLGEDICDGVAREVLEETGVRAEFQGILFFRQQHKMAFGISDLYVHPVVVFQA